MTDVSLVTYLYYYYLHLYVDPITMWLACMRTLLVCVIFLPLDT